jgi:hypothetical protein
VKFSVVAEEPREAREDGGKKTLGNSIHVAGKQGWTIACTDDRQMG